LAFSKRFQAKWHWFASRKRGGRQTGLFSADFPPLFAELNLGMAGGGGYTLGRHE
jgi:hypothetical protein